jgi:hypothetical protein
LIPRLLLQRRHAFNVGNALPEHSCLAEENAVMLASQYRNDVLLWDLAAHPTEIGSQMVPRSNQSWRQIESNKGEYASMLLAVRAHEPALAEAHVGLESQPCRGSSGGFCSSPAAACVR